MGQITLQREHHMCLKFALSQYSVLHFFLMCCVSEREILRICEINAQAMRQQAETAARQLALDEKKFEYMRQRDTFLH